MENMDLLSIVILLVVIFIGVLIIRTPIVIARNRGIGGNDLITISTLSWIGIINGITWIVSCFGSFYSLAIW